ncbi:small integral membrane protein 30-like [Carcharodon carcharias]|uniref:small integral membrane protein 30-like n=1 Tax=Carcharodon carcharias TaxID=13397 RepID=UPI001B7F65AF|nr:small integral membrane protein 30-like [Carcharodon carcharias]
MASWRVWQAVWVCVLALPPVAQAFDGGDAVALLLGLALSAVGVCACLGWYSRRRNPQL